MLRPAILALAFFAAPAVAGHYHAQPAAKPEAARLILRDTIWSCGESGCAAGKSNSRPAIVCEVLVKEVGPLRSFSVDGRALTPQQLEKCNGRAG